MAPALTTGDATAALLDTLDGEARSPVESAGAGIEAAPDTVAGVTTTGAAPTIAVVM